MCRTARRLRRGLVVPVRSASQPRLIERRLDDACRRLELEHTPHNGRQGLNRSGLTYGRGSEPPRTSPKETRAVPVVTSSQMNLTVCDPTFEKPSVWPSQARCFERLREL